MKLLARYRAAVASRKSHAKPAAHVVTPLDIAANRLTNGNLLIIFGTYVPRDRRNSGDHAAASQDSTPLSETSWRGK